MSIKTIKRKRTRYESSDYQTQTVAFKSCRKRSNVEGLLEKQDSTLSKTEPTIPVLAWCWCRLVSNLRQVMLGQRFRIRVIITLVWLSHCSAPTIQFTSVPGVGCPRCLTMQGSPEISTLVLVTPSLTSPSVTYVISIACHLYCRHKCNRSLVRKQGRRSIWSSMSTWLRR
jgi:hypothetical protein